MLKKSWLYSGLIFLIVLMSNAIAFADSGLYIGASVGNTSIGVETPEGGDLDFDLEDSDLGYKVYGGFKFTMAAVEAGYINFGKIEGNAGSATVKGLNAFGMLSTGIGPVSVFAKAGGFIWNTDVEVAQQKYKEDGFDPAFGLGASIKLLNLSARAEYEYYNIDGFDKLSMISAGITFWIL